MHFKVIVVSDCNIDIKIIKFIFLTNLKRFFETAIFFWNLNIFILKTYHSPTVGRLLPLIFQNFSKRFQLIQTTASICYFHFSKIDIKLIIFEVTVLTNIAWNSVCFNLQTELVFRVFKLHKWLLKILFWMFEIFIGSQKQNY